VDGTCPAPSGDSSQASQSGLCFVVHRHHAQGKVHWDLMLERPGQPSEFQFSTWRLDYPPYLLNVVFHLCLVAIQDHRAAFIEYEGLLSGGRGWCRRVDRGVYHLVFGQEHCRLLRFQGDHLNGLFWLKAADQAGIWVLRRADGMVQE